MIGRPVSFEIKGARSGLITRKTILFAVIGIVLISGLTLWLINFDDALEEPPAEETPPAEVIEDEESAEEEVVEEEEPPEEVEEEVIIDPPGPETQENILLLGLDERGLSDAIVIVSYDTRTYEAAFISVKRDTYVDFQTWSPKGRGHSAIGWASYVGMGYGGSDYLGGARFTAETIEKLLGIEINSYAAVTFDGFIKLIDALGGVSVDVNPLFAERTRNPLPPGLQHLDGKDALSYARHRQKPRIPEPGSQSEDGDRIRRNQGLLKAVFEQCRQLSSEELLAVYDQLENNIHSNMDRWDLLTLINIFYDENPELIDQVVLPGYLETVYEKEIDQELIYYFLNQEESNELLQSLGLK